MSNLFQKKCDALKKKFFSLSTEERYAMLIQMGRELPPFADELKTPARIVRGCQSLLYLNALYRDGQLFFEAYADALISAGLAALLIVVYSGESPEIILTSPPRFIEELGIGSSLSPHRSNGLIHIHLRMKQEALLCISSVQA